MESLKQPGRGELSRRNALSITAEFGLCSHAASGCSCQPSCVPQRWGSGGCPTFSSEVLYKLLSASALLSCADEELEATV